MKILYVMICLVIGGLIGGGIGIEYFYLPASQAAVDARTIIVKQEKSITYWTNYGTNLWAQYCTMTNDYTYTKMRLAGFTSTYDARIKEQTDKIAHLRELLALKPSVVEKVVTQVVTTVAEPQTDVHPYVVSTLPVNGDVGVAAVNEIRIQCSVPMTMVACDSLHGFDDITVLKNITYEGSTIVIRHKLRHAAFYSIRLWLKPNSAPRDKNALKNAMPYIYSVDCQ